MKKTLLLLTSLVATATVYGQGTFFFDSISGSPTSAVTVGAANAGAGEGVTGAFTGAGYTASFVYELGTLNQAQFNSGTPIVFSANSAFFGATGTAPSHGPTQDGAGLFAYAGGPGGNSVVTMAGVGPQAITLEIAVWYSGGGATSYAQALGAGVNVGESSVIHVTTATSPTPTPVLNGIAPFTVGTVPEPT